MEELFDKQKRCLKCKSFLRGRSDKKFCSLKCKNAFNNQINGERESRFKNDEKQMRKNWTVLDMFYKNSEGKEFIPIIPLYQQGFDPKYFCGTVWLKGSGETVYISYNYAFLIDHSKGIKIFYKDGGFHTI